MASSYIAWYLFLAGAGAGAFLMGAVVDGVLRFSDRPWFVRVAPVTDAGLVVGPALVAVSGLFLIFDLGAPERALSVFFSPKLSVLGFGAWSVLLFCVFSVAAFAFGRLGSSRIASAAEAVCQVLATVLSLCVMLYSGVYFSLFPAVPFLNTPWIPVLFFASSFAVGMAMLILVGFFRQDSDGVSEGLDGLVLMDILAVAVEIAMIAGFFIQGAIDGGSILPSLDILMGTGPVSTAFWFGVVVFGCLAPLAIDLICLQRPDAKLLAVGACCTSVGGLCLRFVLLGAAIRYGMVDMSIQSFWM